MRGGCGSQLYHLRVGFRKGTVTSLQFSLLLLREHSLRFAVLVFSFHLRETERIDICVKIKIKVYDLWYV